MKGFWNDPEGLTVSDVLAFLFGVPLAVLLGSTAWRFLKGTLTEAEVGALQAIVPLAVVLLGGYYGNQMFMNRWGGMGWGTMMGQGKEVLTMDDMTQSRGESMSEEDPSHG